MGLIDVESKIDSHFRKLFYLNSRNEQIFNIKVVKFIQFLLVLQIFLLN